MLRWVQIPRWLRIICVGVWLLAGSTSVPRLARDPRFAAMWIVPFVAFGVLFWIGTDRRSSRARTVGCLIAEAALAAVLSFLGMPAFEGALFALVAAQLPLALPVRIAAAWGLVQAVALFIVLPR